MSIIAVTGSRTGKLSPTQTAKFCRLLLDLCDRGKRNFLRHGGCTGIDTEASEVADAFLGSRLVAFGIELSVNAFPVNHDLDGSWPGAGPRRNGRMLTHQPMVEELIALPGDKGTASCVQIAKRLQIRIWQWSESTQDFVEL